MSRTATARPKVHRRPRMLALWGHTLVDSARTRALQLHKGKPRLEWESKDGYVELKVTVRGAGCAECGRKIQPGTLAIHAFSGDTGRTPHARFIHLSRCTAACPDCNWYPCRCRRLLKIAALVPALNPELLAARGLERPSSLTWDEIQRVCELALRARREGAA